ncbi:MAG: LysM peptidoglycan-binding domain-containing protein [Gammaproteobacteria bacterium]
MDSSNVRNFCKTAVILILLSTFTYLAACAATEPVYNGLANPVYPKSYYFAGNIWNKLAAEFELPDETPINPEVRRQIDWYMSNKTYLIKIAKRSEPYLYYIFQQVKKRNLPAELTLLPIVESEYQPLAYSKVGAAGLWQIMPGTASGFGLKIDWWYDGRRDIKASTNAALDYFSYLGNFFSNNWILAIAAYDAGDGTVDAAIRHNAKLGKSTDFWHLPLSRETKSYVPKLLALATIIKYPKEYPINLPPIKNTPYLAEVDVGSQINLTQAAKMADISLEELIKLNPAYNRWATDPDGSHKLLLPIDKAASFKIKLSRLPKSKLVTWKRYTTKNGDSLSNLAHKFKTTVSLLRHVNNLKNNQIYQNQTLLIPTTTNKFARSALTSQHTNFLLQRKIPEIKITKYKVKPNDNIWTIAKKYQVKPQQIIFWNGMKKYTDLKVGQRLIIWPPVKHTHTITYKMHYKVQRGDSLDLIAHHYHTTATKLKKLNSLKKNQIKIGQVLLIERQTTQYKTQRIPTYHPPKRIIYHVRAGDTLSTIAMHNKVSVAALEHWNKINNANHLKLHQELIIYR